jgi:EAL domain-containing protein (putative c-di-GMP-specific phosphodiesterase class I)
VSDQNLRSESLKLIVKPSHCALRSTLQPLGFQPIPAVPPLLYRDVARSQLAIEFNRLNQHLSTLEQSQSRFIVTGTALDAQALLMEFLEAKPLSDMTRLIEYGWFLQVMAQETLFFHYQPIFNLSSGRAMGYECLARATDAQGCLFSGHQLIQAAQRLDLSHAFDRLARTTCLEALGDLWTQMEECEDAPLFFVNLLPNAIVEDPRSLERNFQQVLDLGLRAEQIVFELTEVEALAGHPELAYRIQQIRDWGFGLAVDDLGSNVGLDHYYTEFRPDLIKLDRRLIHGCSRHPLKQVMVKSLLHVSHESGIAVLAEGLESPEDIAFCQAIGIDLGQGYGLGMPKTIPWTMAQIEALPRAS